MEEELIALIISGWLADLQSRSAITRQAAWDDLLLAKTDPQSSDVLRLASTATRLTAATILETLEQRALSGSTNQMRHNAPYKPTA